MGLKSSPSLCCLVVNKLVNRILQMSEHIESFHIYMDDSLLFWSGTMEELDEFIGDINELHPTLKFTYSASHEEIQFLDLIIYKGERFKQSNILDIRNFTKPTETWCYLDRNSCHSPSVFRGFMKGEMIRLARNCNNRDEYEQRKSVFTEKLIARGYSRKEVTETSKEVDFDKRNEMITEKIREDKIPLVFKLNYYPHITSKHIKNALLRYWDIISEHPELNRIFPEVPIIAYSRTKNLKDDLVRARLPILEDTGPHGEQENDSRPGSPTLHMLQDLEMESRGLNDFFTLHYDIPDSPPKSPTLICLEELEEEGRVN